MSPNNGTTNLVCRDESPTLKDAPWVEGLAAEKNQTVVRISHLGEDENSPFGITVKRQMTHSNHHSSN